MNRVSDEFVLINLNEPLLEQEGENEEPNVKINTPCKLDEKTIKKIGGVLSSLCLIGIGAWNTALFFDPHLFRSPNDTSLSPNLTEKKIEVMKDLYLGSGFCFLSSGAILLSKQCLENVPENVKRAMKVSLIAGTMLELAPFIVAFIKGM